MRAVDSDSVIIYASNQLGPQISVGGQSFSDGNPEEVAKWVHGFKQLLERAMIQKDGEESVFRVQNKGFGAIKELRGD